MRQTIDWIPRIPWKRLARWSLVIYFIIMISISLAGIWLFPAYVHDNAAEFIPMNSWNADQVQTGLKQLGWPATVPAYTELARNIFLILCFGSVGLLLLWRKSDDWFGLYLALAFISLCGGNATFAPLMERFPGLLALNDFLGAASWQFFFILFFFFPTGRPEPGWARWLAFTWLGWIIIQPFSMGFWLSSMTFLVFAFPFIAIGSQVYRYFRRSNRIERQQTKWVLVAVGLIFINILFALTTLYSPIQESSLGRPLVISIVSVSIFNISIGLVPLSIAAAIFRYRLWDIDLIIRRTLVYGVLSGLLGLVYFGSVVLLRQLLGGVTGNSSAAIVLSTLLIAALFSPLRRALQEGIDRRFFRRKYDSAQAVAAFSATTRGNLSLEELNQHLIEIINQTLEPEHASLRLKKAPHAAPGNALRNASRTHRE